MRPQEKKDVQTAHFVIDFDTHSFSVESSDRLIPKIKSFNTFLLSTLLHAPLRMCIRITCCHSHPSSEVVTCRT
jgi:hypothetical protein